MAKIHFKTPPIVGQSLLLSHSCHTYDRKNLPQTCIPHGHGALTLYKKEKQQIK